MNKSDFIYLSIIVIILISICGTYILYNNLLEFKEGFENLASTPSPMKEPLAVDAVIYINLDFRKDRNEEILGEIRRIGFPESKIHRLSAVKRSWGALGCALSHKAVLDFIIEHKWDKVLVLEDDAGFEDGQVERWSNGVGDINQLIASSGLEDTDSKWDVIFLGGFVRDENGPIKTEYKTLWRTRNTSCAHAYIIRGKYCPKVREETTAAIQMLMKRPSNYKQYFLDNAWGPLMKSDKWYIALPTLAFQRESYSDIEGKTANSEAPLRGNVVRAWKEGSLLG
jgi:GR25 family glycosyltransferase involved in LPS biosynthesis